MHTRRTLDPLQAPRLPRRFVRDELDDRLPSGDTRSSTGGDRLRTRSQRPVTRPTQNLPGALCGSNCARLDRRGVDGIHPLVEEIEVQIEDVYEERKRPGRRLPSRPRRLLRGVCVLQRALQASHEARRVAERRVRLVVEEVGAQTHCTALVGLLRGAAGGWSGGKNDGIARQKSNVARDSLRLWQAAHATQRGSRDGGAKQSRRRRREMGVLRALSSLLE